MLLAEADEQPGLVGISGQRRIRHRVAAAPRGVCRLGFALAPLGPLFAVTAPAATAPASLTLGALGRLGLFLVSLDHGRLGLARRLGFGPCLPELAGRITADVAGALVALLVLVGALDHRLHDVLHRAFVAG